MDRERPIAQLHGHCYQSFHRLYHAATTSELQWLQPDKPAFVTDLGDELDKYQLWAGNVGAGHAKYKLSLDYRLEEASLYRNIILDTMNSLRRDLSRALSMVSEPMPRNIHPDHDQDEDTDSDESISMSDISTDSGSGNISAAGDASSPEISKGMPGDREAILLLLTSIRLSIASLYRMKVRSPAPLDRLTDTSTDDFKCYQHFDLMHVRNKFPNLETQAAVGIAKAMTRRRFLLRYRALHQERLSLARQTNRNIEYGIQTDGKSHVTSSEVVTEATKLKPEQQILTSSDTAPKPVISNIATKLPDQDVTHAPSLLAPPEPTAEDSMSTTSDAASNFTKDSPVSVPPRPKALDGEFRTHFECNYCRVPVLIGGKNEDARWRKHVLHDLLPYVCTFSNCSLSGHTFDNRASWWEHEVETHRVEFFCNDKDHHVYADGSSFQTHMMEDHGISKTETLSLLGLFKQPSSSSTTTCNLCGNQSTQLKAHVSRHLQHLALFAIPRSDYLIDEDASDEDTDEISKNARQVKADTESTKMSIATSKDSSTGSQYHIDTPSDAEDHLEAMDEEDAAPPIDEEFILRWFDAFRERVPKLQPKIYSPKLCFLLEPLLLDPTVSEICFTLLNVKLHDVSIPFPENEIVEIFTFLSEFESEQPRDLSVASAYFREQQPRILANTFNPDPSRHSHLSIKGLNGINAHPPRQGRPFDIQSVRCLGKICEMKTIMRNRTRGLEQAYQIMECVKALRAVRHRHCVEIIGSFTTLTLFGIVTSPYADCDLESYLEIFPYPEADDLKDAPWTTSLGAALCSYFGCLVGALCSIHNDAQIWAHGNINPQSILFQNGKVFLADFSPGGQWNPTKRRYVSTTPKYAPPQKVFHGVSSMSDIWSLGCVFLEMVLVLRGRKVKASEIMGGESDTDEFEWSRERQDNALSALWEESNKDYRCLLDWIKTMLQWEPEGVITSMQLKDMIFSFRVGDYHIYSGENREPDLRNPFVCDQCCWGIKSKEWGETVEGGGGYIPCGVEYYFSKPEE